jgi:Tfp pilus assembly protein PilF
MLHTPMLPSSCSSRQSQSFADFRFVLPNCNELGNAADLLREALKTAPTNATYHYHLGMVYEKQNKRAAAKTQLELALQINPDYPDAHHSRATLR